MVGQWCEEITELSLIGKTHPQAAYFAFTSGYKHKIRRWNKKIRSKIEKKRIEKQRTLSSLGGKMPHMEIRLNDLAQKQVSFSWLAVLPTKRLGFNLSKSRFWDAVRLRYGLHWKDF